MRPVECILKAILETLNVKHYKNSKKLDIEGYVTFNRNRKNVNGGGVSTSVIKDDSQDTLKVKEGSEKHNDEFVITRHSQFEVPINIINVYGESESRAKNNEVEDRWYRILAELKTIELTGESAIVI